MITNKLTLVGLLFISSAVTARPFGARLTGNEIIVQFAKVAPGMSTEGIYAIDKDGDLQTLVAFGKYPRWAPSHRRFAFQLGTETWVADINRHKMDAVQDSLAFLPDPYGVFEVILPETIMWIDNDHVVRWAEVSAGEDPSMRRRTPLMISVGGPSPLTSFIPEQAASVGRVSASADGRYAAFETFYCTRGLGVSDRKVNILDLHDGTCRTVRVGKPGTLPLNPIWAPDRRRMLVDVIFSDHRRETLIYNAETDTAETLAPPTGGWPDWMQGIGWDPSGHYLLVAAARSHGQAWTAVHLLAYDDNRSSYVRVLTGASYVYRACWAPDGGSVAILQGQSDMLAAHDSIELMVVGIDGERRQLQFPDCLVPIWLDW